MPSILSRQLQLLPLQVAESVQLTVDKSTVKQSAVPGTFSACRLEPSVMLAVTVMERAAGAVCVCVPTLTQENKQTN